MAGTGGIMVPRQGVSAIAATSFAKAAEAIEAEPPFTKTEGVIAREHLFAAAPPFVKAQRSAGESLSVVKGISNAANGISNRVALLFEAAVERMVARPEAAAVDHSSVAAGKVEARPHLAAQCAAVAGETLVAAGLEVAVVALAEGDLAAATVEAGDDR
jgi:hypothetical protein